MILADTATGRRAGVAGTRLGVWEIIAVWNDLGRNDEALARQLSHLARWQLSVALEYYRRYPEEIDRAMARNQRLADDLEPSAARVHRAGT